MPKYLIQASYTTEGAKGLAREGGSARAAVVSAAIEAQGGRLEAFYFAFGENDAVILADMPDNVTAAAVGVAVNAAGGATCRTTVLLTPQEIDAAVRKNVSYRAPGQ